MGNTKGGSERGEGHKAYSFYYLRLRVYAADPLRRLDDAGGSTFLPNPEQVRTS